MEIDKLFWSSEQSALPGSIQADLPATVILKPQVCHEKVRGTTRCFTFIDLEYLCEGPRLKDGPVDGEALLTSIKQIISSRGSYITKNTRRIRRHY